MVVVARKWLVGLGLVIASISPALSQKTPNQLQQENVTNFPSCGTQCIDAFKLRSFNSDVINSTWNLLSPPLTGVVAGTYGGNGPVKITVGADGRLSLATGSTGGSYTFTQPLVINTQGLAATFGGMTTINTTPSQVAWDTSQSSVAGQNPKLSLLGAGYGAGQYGFGVSSNSLDSMVPTGAGHAFWVQGVSEAVINAGGMSLGSATGATGSTTPTQLAMDFSFSTVSGQNPKLSMFGAGFGAGQIGLGMSIGQFDYMVPTGTTHNWYVQGVRQMRVGLNSAVLGTQSASGTVNPTQLSFDGSFSSVAGSNAKINLTATGNGASAYGFGVSTGSLDYLAPLNSAHTFWANGVQVLKSQVGLLNVGSGSAVGSTTPTQLAMDQTFSSVSGSNPKISLQGAGNGLGLFGFGISTGSLDYVAPTGNLHTFYVNGVAELAVGSALVSAKVPVQLPGFTIAGLPACTGPLTGATAYVTNGQTTPPYLGPVSTTGTTVAPVFCNGTGWVYN